MPIVRLDAGKNLEVAVAELLATTEYPQIARWIQFPTAVALFVLVPNDPESGLGMSRLLDLHRHEKHGPEGLRGTGRGRGAETLRPSYALVQPFAA